MNTQSTGYFITPFRSANRGRPACLPLTQRMLHKQTLAFQGTGGISAESRSQGFSPAFLDRETGEVHIARYADGRAAAMHLLDGLPEAWIVARDPRGRAIAVRPSVTAGFVRDGRFYTREEAAATAGNQAS